MTESHKNPVGRPPGPLSATERESRRAGGRARHQRKDEQAADPPPVTDPAEAIEPAEPLAPDVADLLDSDDARITRRFAAHLRRNGVPRDWSESLTAERVRREIAAAVIGGIEADQKAGRLVERELLDRSIAKVRDAGWKYALQVPPEILRQLPDLPIELRQRIKLLAEAAVERWARDLRTEMTTS